MHRPRMPLLQSGGEVGTAILTPKAPRIVEAADLEEEVAAEAVPMPEPAPDAHEHAQRTDADAKDTGDGVAVEAAQVVLEEGASAQGAVPQGVVAVADLPMCVLPVRTAPRKPGCFGRVFGGCFSGEH